MKRKIVNRLVCGVRLIEEDGQIALVRQFATPRANAAGMICGFETDGKWHSSWLPISIEPQTSVRSEPITDPVTEAITEAWLKKTKIPWQVINEDGKNADYVFKGVMVRLRNPVSVLIGGLPLPGVKSRQDLLNLLLYRGYSLSQCDT